MIHATAATLVEKFLAEATLLSEKFKKEMDEFRAKIAIPNSSLIHTLSWKAEPVIIAEMNFRSMYEVSRWLTEFKEKGITLSELLKEILSYQEENERQLTGASSSPWKHTSSSYMSNLENMCKAESLAFNFRLAKEWLKAINKASMEEVMLNGL